VAIYDLSKVGKQGACHALEEDFTSSPEAEESHSVKGRFFSTLAARLFFLILLVADLVWMGCVFLGLIAFSIAVVCTGGTRVALKDKQMKRWVSLRRSLVCAVALLLALFSPSFGIMVACTYFLMYDKTGIEEVVPSSLQAQFKDLMPNTIREK
jgi:hypothetical protein